MKLQELLDSLKSTKQKLDNAGIDDLSKIDLEILIEQFKKKIIISGFDPLIEISSVQVPDIDNLYVLIEQVDIEIEKEEKRIELLTSVMTIAKKGLSVIGKPL